jgi:hypothetical protein
VVVCGFWRDIELVGGFLRSVTGGDQPQDLDFARG